MLRDPFEECIYFRWQKREELRTNFILNTRKEIMRSSKDNIKIDFQVVALEDVN
jgi:hypothetical protein